jgi:hypothetical protein
MGGFWPGDNCRIIAVINMKEKIISDLPYPATAFVVMEISDAWHIRKSKTMA